jgi:predicted DNA-binding transcriptional regulator AlpA
VTAEYRAALRTVAEGLPAGTIVPTTREQILELLIDTDGGSSPPPTPEQLLGAEEVRRRLGVGKQWVYRNARQLGAVKIGRALKFSERGLARFIQRRSLGRLGGEGQ